MKKKKPSGEKWIIEVNGEFAGWIEINGLNQKFFEHNGFDFEAIEHAMKQNEKKKGKKVIGGSTISQQTAKNVFCWPQRSWLRKGVESYFTFLIEMLWPKKRILEVYMNIVELGPGVYGVEAASQQFWNKSATRISKRQAALLAAVLPRPLKYSAKNPGSYVSRRADRIVRQVGNFPAANLKKGN